MKSALRLLSVLSLVIVSQLGAAPKPAPELPVADFFGNPAITQLRFSPDGKFIAALVPFERRMNLVIMDIEKKSKQLITGFKDYGITMYRWANNERLILLLDDDGDEDYMAYGINRDGKHFDKFAAARGFGERDPKRGDRILVFAAVTHSDRIDPCWMDVNTGKISVITKNPGNVSAWVMDRQHQARFALVEEKLRQSILYRKKNGDEWKTIATFEDGHESWKPIAFDGDNRTAYVLSDLGRKTMEVRKFDTETLSLGETVYADDTYDAEGVVWSSSLNKVVGVTIERDKPYTHWLDEGYRRRQAILDQSFPGYVVAQNEATDDGSQIIAYARSDREPGVYYLFDESKKKIEELAVVRPKIDPEQMAEMKPIAYAARDGLTIHGYLTLPVGREAQALPLVVNPHGGPFGPRDTWGFQSEVQFLANRGFAVLQPNFRGSGGYGREFEARGYRQWGKAMQNDVSDGVAWLIQQGIVDPKRVVIMGASYGGYAVLAGLVYTPELYCAGINYVGVSNLKLIAFQRRGTENSKLWMRTRVGDYYDDARDLEQYSPVNHVERIRAPLLMAYGRSDPRVTREHGDDLKSALESHKKDYEFIMETGEGHGFRKEEKSVGFYTKVDSFLKTKVLDKTQN